MRLTQKVWFIPLIYLIIGTLWITLSDDLLFSIMNRSGFKTETISMISQWKGIFFVIITATLLYFLIQRRTNILYGIKNDFKRLFEDNPSPMFIINNKTKDIILANNAAIAQYGYTKLEFKSLNYRDLRPDQKNDQLFQRLKDPKEGLFDFGDWIHVHKNGSQFYANVLSHKTIYKNKACRIITSLNVDEKIRAKRERKDLLKAINNAALIAKLNLQGEFVEINEEFSKVSGFNQNELMGKKLEILESPKHEKNQLFKDIWPKIKNGNVWRGDLIGKGKNGENFWIDTSISPIIDNKGEIYGLMAISYDITDKKYLQQNQKKLLDDFSDYAFQTSHELRGPLTSMLGLTELFYKYDDSDYLIKKMKETSEEMDQVIRKMNNSLSRNALDIVSQKRYED